MEPISIILIVVSIVSILLHGYHLKRSKCRVGNENSCCDIVTEVEEAQSNFSSE